MTDIQSSASGQAVAEGRLSNATRYLCAGAYLDSGFMRQVLEQVVYPAHRGVAPSYGIDVAPIARHCLRASRRVLARDAVITILLAIGVAFLPAELLVYLLLLYGVVLLLRLLGALASRDFSSLVGTTLVLIGTALLFLLNGKLAESWAPTYEIFLD